MKLGVAAPSCNNEKIKSGRLDYQSNIPSPTQPTVREFPNSPPDTAKHLNLIADPFRSLSAPSSTIHAGQEIRVPMPRIPGRNDNIHNRPNSL